MVSLDGPLVLAQLYWKQDDSGSSSIILFVIGAIFLVAIAYSLIKKVVSGQGISFGIPKKSSLRGSVFRRRAEDSGFSSDEAEFLELYARKMGVTSAQSVFGTKNLLDAFIRNTFKYIERHADSEATAEDHKSKLFAMREALERRSSSGSAIRSTRQLKAKTPLSIVTANKTHYSSILVLNESKAMYLEPALDAFGSPIRISRGSRLTLYFYSGSHVGYSFLTRSRGLVDIDGRKFLSISHSDKIKPLPSRKHQRSEVHISGRFYLVHVRAAKDKGKVIKTVQVEKAAVAGVITDLSGGGLTMQTMSPAKAGDFIKVEFDLGAGLRPAFASVVRVSKTRNASLMHTKFVRISRKTVNEIRAMVYGYE